VKDRRRTSTSSFGVSGRESHDASGFYDRFRTPELSSDRDLLAPMPVPEPFQHGDARSMDAVPDGSVGLVITSPPYFAGKTYEEELERDGVPSSYLEYLEMLTEVFAECVTKLEPGGRIAVNVANLGRKPYRSLSSDVIRILEHDLGLLLRGEVIWQKGEGASGSCAWGSYRSASNPVLRDLTERVIIASKGRFDRARPVKERSSLGLPSESTLSTDDFLELTLDVWSIPPESARRVGHPAPFPVELPEQLIRLYSFADDLVLDPFMGSGSTLVAASKLGRRFIGYDLDVAFVDLARARVEAEGAPIAVASGDRTTQQRHVASAEGRSAVAVCLEALSAAGFTTTATDVRIPKSGLSIAATVEDATRTPWQIEVAGSFTSHRGGLTRADVVLKTLGRLNVLRGRLGPQARLLVVTCERPGHRSEAENLLRAAGPDAFFDVIDVFDDDDLIRLRHYGSESAMTPLEGFWTPKDLAAR